MRTICESITTEHTLKFLVGTRREEALKALVIYALEHGGTARASFNAEAWTVTPDDVGKMLYFVRGAKEAK